MPTQSTDDFQISWNEKIPRNVLSPMSKHLRKNLSWQLEGVNLNSFWVLCYSVFKNKRKVVNVKWKVWLDNVFRLSRKNTFVLARKYFPWDLNSFCALNSYFSQCTLQSLFFTKCWLPPPPPGITARVPLMRVFAATFPAHLLISQLYQQLSWSRSFTK